MSNANALCFLVLFETRGVRLSNLDGGRNNGNPYFYNAKSMKIRINQRCASGNRKIKLLARTRMRSVRRCEIYVLSVTFEMPIFLEQNDDFR